MTDPHAPRVSPVPSLFQSMQLEKLAEIETLRCPTCQGAGTLAFRRDQTGPGRHVIVRRGGVSDCFSCDGTGLRT